ncbi:MAG TPA: murein L,D-transpeptidase catalytic domain family protein [Terriglobales bacterium]|nr:murein L,D-transpeptidase catalytic domain family protein [Terriglobales bacterium]
MPLPKVAPIVDTSWPRREVLKLAVQAYRCGEQRGQFDRPVLTVVDYSLPSSQPRLWVIDLEQKKVLHHELVAHGEKTGENMAVSFSNRVGSHQSSLGLYRTENTYHGQFGYSLRLSGLERGINDKARERAIVMHGQADVSRSFAAKWGTIARSWGCLSVPPEVAPQIIDSIAGGSAIFVYYPDSEWLADSHYLNCEVQVAGAGAPGQ